jgi:putative ABC transport system permease protein
LRPLLGLEGKLAAQQLDRQPTRTSLTVGVLFIGVLVTVSFGNALLNSISDIDSWYRHTIPSDYLIRAALPEPTTVFAAPLAPALAEEIRALPGVAVVGRVSFVLTLLGGDPVVILARDSPPGKALPMELLDISSEEAVRAALERGAVVVGTTLAQRRHYGVGDTLTLPTRTGPREFRIAGVANEYTGGGMAVYLAWDAADRLLHLPGVHAFEVYLDAGRQGKELPEWCAARGLLLQSNQELWASIDRMVEGVVGFMWILIVLVFLVASLGIVNTLTMNVIEQTRELGILRALGMRRAQMRKLVLTQALFVGVISVVPGLPCGLVTAWLMNLSSPAMTGHLVAFQWRWGFVLGCAAAALAVSVLAALLPARRAARLRVIEALQYE